MLAMLDPALSSLALAIAALLTSTVAGVFGLGGGMLLISIVPFFIAPNAIIPVHGSAQLASNFSRSLFSFSRIAWSLFPQFLIGSLVGVAIVALFLSLIPVAVIPAFIGLYILVRLWLPKLSERLSHLENMLIVGALQTGLGLIVGATGPMTTTILAKRYTDKDVVVATNALMMAFSHLAKIILFTLLGFSFVEYWLEILALVFGATLGSYIGTRLRQRLDNTRFFQILQWLLTILALRMIGLTLWSLFSDE